MALLPLFWLAAVWCGYRFYITADLVWLAAASALVMLAFVGQRKVRAAAVAGVIAVACFAAEPGGREQLAAALAGRWGATALALCTLLVTAFGLRLMLHMGSVRQADRAMTRPVRGDHS